MYWYDPPVVLTISTGDNYYDVSGGSYSVPSDASFVLLEVGNKQTGSSPPSGYWIKFEALCESDPANGYAGQYHNPGDYHQVLAPVMLYDHGSGAVASLRLYSNTATGTKLDVRVQGYLSSSEATALGTKVTICDDITIPQYTAAWQETSLLGKVPASAEFAVIETYIYDTVTAANSGIQKVNVRPTGSTMSTYTASVQTKHHFIVPLSATNKSFLVQCQASTPADDNESITWRLVGYIKSGSRNMSPETDDKDTPITASTWVTVTASGGGQGGGVIIYTKGGGVRLWRATGSTYDRSGTYSNYYTPTMAIVKTDSSFQYQMYVSGGNAGTDTFNTYGYIEKAYGLDTEVDASDTLLANLHTPPDFTDNTATADDTIDYGDDYEETLPESATVDESTDGIRDYGRTFAESATVSDSTIGSRSTPGTGSGSYSAYTGYGVGQTSVPQGLVSYPNYTIVATTKQDNFGISEDVYYPWYVGTGTGTTTGAGTIPDPSDTDIYPLYKPYTIVATTAVGATGTSDNSRTVYPAYTGVGYYYTGTGTGEYPSYVIQTTTPGAGSATATDFLGTASLTYRAYTVEATTSGEIHGSGSISYPFLYTGIGYGFGDTSSLAAGTSYWTYYAVGVGASGTIGSASLTYPVYTITASGSQLSITADAVSSNFYPHYNIEAHGLVDNWDVVTGRLVTPDGEAYVDADGNFIIIHDPVPPSHEVMFSAMNLRKRAVTEYHNYGFNSITKNNGYLMGATHNGIYIMDSLDDDGSDIASNVEKFGADYESGLRKRATDAYIHIRPDGAYIFGSVADGTQVPLAVPDTDTLEHTRKIDLPKGLIGRSLGFIFRNTNGSDFEIEEIELVTDIGSRRAKRYTNA